MSNELLTPVGRLVYGNLYKGNTKLNNDNTPKIGKDGQPLQTFDYGLAIPKGSENHWAETPWGQIIWNVGHASFTQGEAQRPDFAWKVSDGDSTIPNKANKKPCDKEGYPGNWILNFSSSYPSKYVNQDGSRVLMENELIKPGYYVQILGSVSGNSSMQSPGVYLNHGAVSLQSVFEEIVGGVDTVNAGFGQAAMPGGIQRTTMPNAGIQQPPQAPQPQNIPVAGNTVAASVPGQHPLVNAAHVASPTTVAPAVSHAVNTPGNVAPVANYGIPAAPAQ